MIVIRDPQIVGEIMRSRRDYLGMHRDELARLIWSDPRTIRDRDTGRIGYTLPALIDTCRVFGWHVALLGPGEEPADPRPAGLLIPDRRTA